MLESERKGEGRKEEEERGGSDPFLFHLFIHALVDFCMCSKQGSDRNLGT